MRLVEGLHRVGNDLVACYLVADDDGVTLIDAGLSGQWPLLVAELTAMGRTVSEIRGVVLTHGDSDHIGFAERLRAEYGIPVWVHEADAGRARGEGKPSTGWGALRPGPLLRFLWYAARRGGLRTTYGPLPGERGRPRPSGRRPLRGGRADHPPRPHGTGGAGPGPLHGPAGGGGVVRGESRRRGGALGAPRPRGAVEPGGVRGAPRVPVAIVCLRPPADGGPPAYPDRPVTPSDAARSRRARRACRPPASGSPPAHPRGSTPPPGARSSPRGTG